LHFISVTAHDVAMHAVAVNSYLFQKTIQTKNLSLICFRIDHSAKTIPFVLHSTFLLLSAVAWFHETKFQQLFTRWWKIFSTSQDA